MVGREIFTYLTIKLWLVKCLTAKVPTILTLAGLALEAFTTRSRIRIGINELAQPSSREVLEELDMQDIWVSAVREEHSRTLSAMFMLSDVHVDLRNYEEALPLARRVLEVRRRKLGNEHKNTQTSINLVAVILDEGMDDKQSALPLYEEDLRLSRITLGSEHPNTLISIGNVGALRCVLKRYGQGLPLLRECVAGRRSVLGEGDPRTQDAIATLAEHEAAATEEEVDETIDDRLRKRRRFR